jgi:hypothetical protein
MFWQAHNSKAIVVDGEPTFFSGEGFRTFFFFFGEIKRERGGLVVALDFYLAQ